jgi:hypothetical protein
MLLFGTMIWRTGAGTPDPLPPTPPVTADPPRGRAEWLGDYRPDQRSAEDIRKARQRFGVIPPDVQATIAEVAARQAQQLDLDQQKQFDELYRELEIKRLGFEARYMEALALQREALINEEIGRRLRLVMEEDDLILLTLIAAASQL